jgi:hypothetical protein
MLTLAITYEVSNFYGIDKARMTWNITKNGFIFHFGDNFRTAKSSTHSQTSRTGPTFSSKRSPSSSSITIGNPNALELISLLVLDKVDIIQVCPPLFAPSFFLLFNLPPLVSWHFRMLYKFDRCFLSILLI